MQKYKSVTLIKSRCVCKLDAYCWTHWLLFEWGKTHYEIGSFPLHLDVSSDLPINYLEKVVIAVHDWSAIGNNTTVNSLYPLHTSSHLILLGDFNIADVNWSALHARSSSS